MHFIKLILSFFTEIHSELNHEFSVDELINNAKSRTPIKKKLFLVNNKLVRYTKRLHFFNSIRRFDNIDPRSKPIDLTCKICKTVIRVTFPFFTNLSHHLTLDNHVIFHTWLNLNGDSNKIITDSMLDLIKFLVATNASFQTIETPELLNILSPSLREQVPCFKTLRYKLLPLIFKSLRTEINSRLINAKVTKIIYISLKIIF